MSINILGSMIVEIEIKNEIEEIEIQNEIEEIEIQNEIEEIEIPASSFGIEQSGRRNLGDGDIQYEALYMYFGDEFTISFQVTELNGRVEIYPSNVEGNALIVEDNLSAELISNNYDGVY